MHITVAMTCRLLNSKAERRNDTGIASELGIHIVIEMATETVSEIDTQAVT